MRHDPDKVRTVSGRPELKVEQDVEDKCVDDGALGRILEEPEELQIKGICQSLNRPLREQKAYQRVIVGVFLCVR
jgi:hypothetical protein